MIQAFRQFEGDVKLEIIGNGDAAYCARLKLLAYNDKRISFHNAVSEKQMPAIYQNCDCVVIPSLWYETYNFVLREAISCGCLGICSAIGAMPEAVTPGRNGYLFEPGNVQSLVNVLYLAKDFDWTKYTSVSFPSIEDESRRYDVLYQEAIARHHLS